MYTCIHLYIYTYIHTYIHTYLHTYIYTYIQPWLPILPTGPHPQGGGRNHDRGGETTYRKYQMPHPQGEGGTMTMGGRRVSPNLEHIYIYITYIYIYIVLIIYIIYTHIYIIIYLCMYIIYLIIYIHYTYTHYYNDTSDRCWPWHGPCQETGLRGRDRALNPFYPHGHFFWNPPETML